MAAVATMAMADPSAVANSSLEIGSSLDGLVVVVVVVVELLVAASLPVSAV